MRKALSVAISALVIGYVLYAVARPSTSSFLLWHASVPSFPTAAVPAWLLGSAPSFLHTLAFAILLAVAVGGDRRRRVAACVAWGVIEIAAECSQVSAIGQWLDAQAPIVAHLSIVRGFLAGTFAGPDVVGVLAGTGAASTILQR